MQGESQEIKKAQGTGRRVQGESQEIKKAQGATVNFKSQI